MRMRRQARERAVQFLFQYELNPPEELEEALRQFWESQREAAIVQENSPATWGVRPSLPPPSPEEILAQKFSERMIRDVLVHRDELDERIKKHVQNWDIHRIAAVDRNILRLALYELLYREDIPPVVSINEAVDIAKKFSTEESGKFVNGVLDRVRSEIMRPARTVT